MSIETAAIAATAEYRYLGDRLTDPRLKGLLCRAIRNSETGLCVRGRNGSMLVQAESGEIYNVLGRQLRRLDKGRKNGK